MSVQGAKLMDVHRKTIDCNLCGSSAATVVFEAGVAQAARIVKCDQCGLMFSSPRAKPPDQDQIKEWDAGFTKERAKTGLDRFDKEELQVRDYADTRAWLRNAYPNRGRLLEIGCGMGFLLAKFREDGWQVEGIEPNRGYCEIIEEVHGIKASPTILDEAGEPANSFDVIVMLHVIEHVPDPLGSLREIHRVLKPGGTLILETPRYDSLMFKLMRHRERSVSCDGHILFFTSPSLEDAYLRAGFRKVKLSYVGRTLTLDRLVYNLGVMSKSRSLEEKAIALARRLNLQKRKLKLNARDMQRIVVERPTT